MPYTITKLPDVPIVETTYIGVITREDLNRATEDALTLAKANAITLFIKNCSYLEGIHSIADLYLVAGSLEKWSIFHRIKKAIVVSELPFAPNQIQHWEETCRKRGIDVRLFDQRSAALNWLQS